MFQQQRTGHEPAESNSQRQQQPRPRDGKGGAGFGQRQADSPQPVCHGEDLCNHLDPLRPELDGNIDAADQGHDSMHHVAGQVAVLGAAEHHRSADQRQRVSSRYGHEQPEHDDGGLGGVVTNPKQRARTNSAIRDVANEEGNHCVLLPANAAHTRPGALTSNGRVPV